MKYADRNDQFSVIEAGEASASPAVRFLVSAMVAVIVGLRLA